MRGTWYRVRIVEPGIPLELSITVRYISALIGINSTHTRINWIVNF